MGQLTARPASGRNVATMLTTHYELTLHPLAPAVHAVINAAAVAVALLQQSPALRAARYPAAMDGVRAAVLGSWDSALASGRPQGFSAWAILRALPVHAGEPEWADRLAALLRTATAASYITPVALGRGRCLPLALWLDIVSGLRLVVDRLEGMDRDEVLAAMPAPALADVDAARARVQLAEGARRHNEKVQAELAPVLQAMFSVDEMSRVLRYSTFGVQLLGYITPVQGPTPWFAEMVSKADANLSGPQWGAMLAQLIAERPRRKGELIEAFATHLATL